MNASKYINIINNVSLYNIMYKDRMFLLTAHPNA